MKPYSEDCSELTFKQLVISLLVLIFLVWLCFQLGRFVSDKTYKKEASQEEKTVLYPEWKKAADAEAERRENKK